MFAGEITYISKPRPCGRKPRPLGTVMEMRSWADIEQQAERRKEMKAFVHVTTEAVDIAGSERQSLGTSSPVR